MSLSSRVRSFSNSVRRAVSSRAIESVAGVMRRADGQLRVVKLGSPRRLKTIGVKAVLQAFGDRAVSGTFPRENADLLAESELIGRLRTSNDDA